MFKTTISQTPFTSDVANGYFQNITGDSYMSDWSFLATLRALLAPRMGARGSHPFTVHQLQLPRRTD